MLTRLSTPYAGVVPTLALSRAAAAAGVRGYAVPTRSNELMEMEKKYGAHNYHPVPVIFSKASGVKVTDPEGKTYYDFLSAYSAVNQGHAHPRIVKALTEQAAKNALSSRAFYNDMFPQYAKFVTSFFGYEAVLPMNTGAEGVETALKLARKWGYRKKKIAKDKAIILSACGAFHGRTYGAISMSCDPSATVDFGPALTGMAKFDFDDVPSLEAALRKHSPDVAAVIIEPIQGEAGVIVPKDGYLRAVRDLCKQHNALFIADEVQTGLARTGKMLAVDHENVRPDVLILGKALGGGVYPVSAVLADKHIMDVFTPGTHGSTFGGNPLACAVAMESLKVLKEEKLAERADVLGKRLRRGLEDIKSKSPLVGAIRGRGLLNAFDVTKVSDKSAFDVCLLLKERGLLAKPTHNTIIRLAPPLVMTDAEMDECIGILRSTLTDILTMRREDIPGVAPKTAHPDEHCPRCGRVV